MNRYLIYPLLKYTYVLFFLVMTMFPVAIVLLNSFKNSIEINRITILPESLKFVNYMTILIKPDFYWGLFNSVFYVAASCILGLIIVTLAGFSIARRGEAIFGLFYYFFLLSMMIPSGSSLSALYTIILDLNLVNTRTGIILLYTTGAIPMGILLFSGFIKSIPRALDESAIIDGLGYFRRYWYIILPLSKPVIVAFLVLTSIGMWNNFFTSMLFLRDSEKFPLPLLVYAFSSKNQTDYGSIFALMCLSLLPPIIFFLFNQKHFYNGVAVGSVKG